jgi:nitrate reductase assembly molybdenum cofactor insertion protein NarJ
MTTLVNRKKRITNDDIQEGLSRLLQRLDDGPLSASEMAKTKVFLNGTKTMLLSVRLDFEGSRRTGEVLFQRTRDFLK